MKKRTILSTAIIVALSFSAYATIDKKQVPVAGAHLNIEYNANALTEDSLQQIHDELYFQSAVQVALWSMPLVALGQAQSGMEKAGITNTTISIAENKASSDNVIYTANQETIYAYGFTELGEEPMVFTIAPMTLGFVADAWQRPIEDVGLVGPDKGKGGKYIIVPPGYEGSIPKADPASGIYVYQSPTNTVFWLQRAFTSPEQTEADATNMLKETSEIYPLSQEGKPRQQHFVNQSTTPYDAMTHFNGMQHWDMLNKMIQREPVAERDLAMMGLAKTVGLQKGKIFSPTQEQTKILEKALETARAMLVASAFDSQLEGIKTYQGKQWEPAFQTESPYFDGKGHLETHERATFTYQAMTGAKGMVTKMVGQGSQYLMAAKDSEENFLNGSNTYRLTIPKDVPINNYWSVCTYDMETRSLIANGTDKSCIASIDSPQQNADGSFDMFFGPTKPKGINDANFVLTKEGEGWFNYFRFYGPEEAYFDKSWQLNDFELIK